MDNNLEHEVNVQLDRGNASKRARGAAKIILEYGSCTTTDLENHGYKHTPRAIRDLKDAGIKVDRATETYIDESTGQKKTRARYSIIGTDSTRKSRKPIPKKISDLVKSSGICEACGSRTNLQVDHRVPFEIGGETIPHDPNELMPLCASCNRSKSWSCENCHNWEVRDPKICEGCYWSSPNNYSHVSMNQERKIEVSITDPNIIKSLDELNPKFIDILYDWVQVQVNYRKGNKDQ